MAKERQSSVQAMQLSNGLSDPLGLWLGHLLFDSISIVFATTISVAVLAGAASKFFYALGLLVSSHYTLALWQKLTQIPVANHDFVWPHWRFDGILRIHLVQEAFDSLRCRRRLSAVHIHSQSFTQYVSCSA